MAACTKLSTFFAKNEINRLFLHNSKIFQQSTRSHFNCLGEQKGKHPKLSRPKPKIQRRPNDRIIWPDAESVKERGFLRPQKEYIPPKDVEARLNTVFQEVAGTTEKSTKLHDVEAKYKILDACFEQFQHKVPNSLLHKMNSLGSIYHFYSSQVDVRNPLEALQTQDLPPNLHILYNYHRFADDPSKFNGVTAYPESNTVVTGLKYRKKYKGFEAPLVPKKYKDELKM